MADISMIKRPLTQYEKKDFEDIFEEPEKNILQFRETIMQKIRQRNRSIVLRSKSIEDFREKLACESCFRKEFNANIQPDKDFEKLFKAYSGRLEYKTVSYTFRKIRGTNEIEESIVMGFLCNFHNAQDILPNVFYTFSKEEFEEFSNLPFFELLKKKAKTNAGEIYE